jgi:hypothetical protein
MLALNGVIASETRKYLWAGDLEASDDAAQADPRRNA